MRHARSIQALLTLLPLAAACGAPPPEADPPAAPRRALRHEAPGAVADLLAWTPDGALAIADGDTGAIRETAKTLDLGGGRDVAYDPWTGRAVVLEAGGPSHGEVASYAVGDGRLLPTSLGVAVLGDGTWRMIFPGGAPGASAKGPPPMSAWVTEDAKGLALHALAYGPSSGEIDTARAALGPASIGRAAVTPFDADAGTVPPSTRVVPAPQRGGALLLDVAGSFLSVRSVAGATAGPPSRAPLGAAGMRIESAVALMGGEVVVALLSGQTRVVALEVDGDLAIASMAEAALPGDPTPSTRFLSHDLVAQGPGRVAAATSAGVFSLEVTNDAAGVHLALDPAFDGSALRGPLDAVPR
jgi:hypothetical protein